MRIILEVENEDELNRAKSFILENPSEIIQVKASKSQPSKQRSRKDFVQWCRNNKAPIADIPNREERHER